MRLRRLSLLVVALAACGDKSTPAGGGDPSKPAGGGAPPAGGVTATRTWSWGDPPSGDAGPSGPALIAAGNGRLWTVGMVRIAFGERLIGIITSHRSKSLPYADGFELMVELHTVDRKRVAERAMAGQ